MSDLSIQLHWQRTEPELKTGKYSNAHAVQYNGSHELLVDAAPDWGGDPGHNSRPSLPRSRRGCGGHWPPSSSWADR
jgi:hypothetical protein